MEHTFNIGNKINFIKNKNELIKYIDELFRNENYDRIIIWRSSFGGMYHFFKDRNTFLIIYLNKIVWFFMK